MGDRVGLTEYAARLYERKGGRGPEESPNVTRKMISSALTSRRARLEKRLREASLIAGDMSKIQLLNVRLPRIKLGFEMLLHQGLDDARTEEERMKVWNTTLRKQYMSSIFEQVSTPDRNRQFDLERRKVLLLREAIFQQSPEFVELVEDVEPVWQWLIARLQRGCCGEVMCKVSWVADDMMKRGWDEAPLDVEGGT